MKLPKMSYPIYDVQLLSQATPVKIRPFTVKEQQLLLMANEAKDVNTIISSLEQIINNCLLTKLDVQELPLVDMETILLHLRARSIGEVANMYYKCKNEVMIDTGTLGAQPKECGMLLEVPVKLLEVPIINKDTPKRIAFEDGIGVEMKYPSFSLMSKLAATKDTDAEYLTASQCINFVFNKDDIFFAKECTSDELLEFVMGLPSEKYDLMKKFLEKSPKSKLTVEKDCPKCNFHHQFDLEGIEDFFV